MASLHQIVKALSHLRLQMYLIGGGIALLVYDYLLTFPREVSFIWATRWSYMKVLFLLTRYLPFIDAALAIYLTLGNTDIENCHRLFNTGMWFIYIGRQLPLGSFLEEF